MYVSSGFDYTSDLGVALYASYLELSGIKLASFPGSNLCLALIQERAKYSSDARAGTCLILRYVGDDFHISYYLDRGSRFIDLPDIGLLFPDKRATIRVARQGSQRRRNTWFVDSVFKSGPLRYIDDAWSAGGHAFPWAGNNKLHLELNDTSQILHFALSLRSDLTPRSGVDLVVAIAVDTSQLTRPYMLLERDASEGLQRAAERALFGLLYMLGQRTQSKESKRQDHDDHTVREVVTLEDGVNLLVNLDYKSNPDPGFAMERYELKLQLASRPNKIASEPDAVPVRGLRRTGGNPLVRRATKARKRDEA